jgi:2-polyprenyl-3-methyl-5-hydroxy-6-metoxy-1,4-benzoquinol methylase
MKESEIRPQELLGRYLELTAKDAKTCFSDKAGFEDLSCVACGSDNVDFQFKKNEFHYSLCEICGTLYQTPRPSEQAFQQFYKDSESSNYWAEEFFPAVAEIRRNKIFKPRVERLIQYCGDIGLDVNKLVEVGAGYGIFLEEWRKQRPNNELLAIEPSISLAQECRSKGLAVIEASAEEVTTIDHDADLVVCFEVLEHVHDPKLFVSVLRDMVRPGGYVMISTLCIDGFDLQTLWSKSPQISPPHHINFMSVLGFERLFTRAGLEEVEVKTPGLLDVDIIRNASRRDPEILSSQRFLRSIMDDDVKSALFQQFLSQNKMSSHAWVFGKVPA